MSLLVWGAKKTFTNDDSADERAKEILASIPKEFAKFVESVEVAPNGVRLHLRDSTPPQIAKEIKKNIRGGAV